MNPPTNLRTGAGGTFGPAYRGYPFAMMIERYELPELTYSLNGLVPVLSARIMELHHGTHHQSYVNTANDLIEKIAALPKNVDPTPMNRSLAFNVNGHLLHSLFWNSMSPSGGGTPPAMLVAQIERSFGDVDTMIARMTMTVEKLAGSGWAALVWEPTMRRLFVTQIHEHQNDVMSAATPILVIDGWEHAYYLQYEAARAKWANAFWDVVDWDGVAGRLDRLVNQAAFA